MNKVINNLNEKLDLIHKLGILEDLVDFLFDDPDIDLKSMKILLHANKYGIVRPINPRKLKEGFVHHECHVYFDQQLVEDIETGKELFLEVFGKLWGLSEEDLVAVQTNLQTALAASNFLQEAQYSLQKKSALMSNVYKVQKYAETLADELNTKAKGKNIIATYALAAAQKVFNAVAKGNPYLVLAAALVTVVGAIAGLTLAYRKNKEEAEKAAKAAVEQQKKAREATEMWANSVSRSAAKQIMSYKNLQKEWDKLGNNMNAKKAFIDKNQEAFNDLGWSVKNVVENIIFNCYEKENKNHPYHQTTKLMGIKSVACFSMPLFGCIIDCKRFL